MTIPSKTSAEPQSNDLTRHAHELETILKLSRLLGRGLDQHAVLVATLDLLNDELGLTRGIILLLTHDEKGLMLEVAHDYTPYELGRLSYKRGEGIVGKVVETGKPIAISKMSEEPMFLDRIYNRKQRMVGEMSFFCVPILCEKEVLGVLSVDRSYDPNESLDHNLQFLSIVASMIAYDVKLRRLASLQQQPLEEENSRLRSELLDRYRPENIIGNSNAMREVYQAIYQVASSDTTVLIRGESGTGKELVAHAIHFSSPRAKGAFIKVNCAALNENLLESELFGHEKGAFTGAIGQRKGRLEEADGGTLFLDEIGDFSPMIQVKLLRVIQERSFERVGSNIPVRANVRFICATNRNLEEAMAEGRFRNDLYYRINVFPIFLPPLRDRRGDILLLADHFVNVYSKRMNKEIKRISTSAIDMMTSYHWPGNVRELENTIERAALLSREGVIHGHHLPPTLQTGRTTNTTGHGTFAERVAVFEQDIIIDALKRKNGNMAAAAQELGATPRIIRYKIQQYDIDPKQFTRNTSYTK
ncbi:MAG: sigma 54-interacting transcriptional regulator [Planctomycetaceae bacterium]|jgi:Nif-specific regulatory protein|nr:sigma 54-interacting transcriptional regulator [Planctomycetaceae bacterium]